MNSEVVNARTHPLCTLLKSRQKNPRVGILSACTANRIVIEACIEHAKSTGNLLCIEATANQVDQTGGYTGMRPKDFAALVWQLADHAGLSRDAVVLGGDHLGPLTWRAEPAEAAMEKAMELIREYVLAGFTKIHIDTSMRLGDDDPAKPLCLELIAERAALLAHEAETAYRMRKKEDSQAIHPVYVIGSEVPTPGGALIEEAKLEVTRPENAIQTLKTFRHAIEAECMDGTWDHVVAMVVQPGVEFSNDSVHEYSHETAKELVAILGGWPELVFEGHSTDYQTRKCLGQMVEDGIAILKVGPALTYALRKSLFALSDIESELRHLIPEPSCYQEVLEDCMQRDPTYWRGYYHGSEPELRLQRRFSYFDRCRYYLPAERVEAAYFRLISNLNHIGIPPTLLNQYLPTQYRKVREGVLRPDAASLIKDCIQEVLDDYGFAASHGRRCNI